MSRMFRNINKSFGRAYLKYVIKSPVFFYCFLIVGVGIFLYMTLTIRLDVSRGFETDTVSLFEKIFLKAGKME